MKLTLRHWGRPESVVMETEQSLIIEEAYNGPIFVTKDGTCLTVMMRDHGYEFFCWQEPSGTKPDPHGVLPGSAHMFSVDINGVKIQPND